MAAPPSAPDRAFCPQCGQKYAVPEAELRRRPGVRFRATCRLCETPFSVRWAKGALRTEAEEILTEPTDARDVLARGARIGKYEIEELLASGGSSTIYRAFDEGANRTVALKVLHQVDADYELRFQREVEVQGNLKHPNLMPIFDHGTVDGKPYYTMELLQKPTPLDTIVGLFRNNRLSYNPALRRLASLRALVRELLLPVARAIEFANKNGVVHRDLKPRNVILDAPTLRVYVIDFGICHLFRTTGSRLLVRAGETKGNEDKEEEKRRMAMGSVRWMPPEQARGEVSERGDVWALGALLYFVARGEAPIAHAIDLGRVAFDKRVTNLERIAASSRAAGDEDEAAFYEARLEELRSGAMRTTKDLLHDAREGNYAPLPDEIDPSLKAIVHRAMRPEPRLRYPSVQVFADDVQNWLDGRPVRAYAGSLGGAKAALYQTRLYVRRNRTALLAATGVLLAVVIAFFLYRARTTARADWQIELLLRAAREADDPAVQHARLTKVLTMRPGHGEAERLLGLARRYTPLLERVEQARRLRDRVKDLLADGRIESAERLADDMAAVLEGSVLPDLLALPDDYPGRRLATEAEQLADYLRGRRVITLTGLPRGVEVRLVMSRSPADLDLAWEDPTDLGTAPLQIVDHVLQPGSYVLVLRHAKDTRTLHLPFVVRLATPGRATIACPLDPADLPEDMAYVAGVRDMLYGDPRFSEETKRVKLRPFLLDTHEVTNVAYARYVNALEPDHRERAVPRRVVAGTGRTTPLWSRNDDGTWVFPDGAGDHPVAGITMLDAERFARSVGKRLPTPQEWERAARGVDRRDYPFGVRLRRRACNAQTGAVAPVGTYTSDRSPFGVFDLAGNVAEWTDDAGGTLATVKGGSFELARYRAMATSFGKRRADVPYADVGFRCAKDEP